MLFTFLDLNTYSAPLSLSERHGSEIKQLSDAFGMVRKQSYYLPLAEKSIIILWPVAAKPHKRSLTFNKSVAQVHLNCHKYTLSHHRTWREYCRKLVSCRCTATLQKARQLQKAIAVFHDARSCAKCMH